MHSSCSSSAGKYLKRFVRLQMDLRAPRIHASYATERHDIDKELSQARHELVVTTTATNGSLYNQAISENASVNCMIRLRMKLRRNARGILARCQHQCQPSFRFSNEVPPTLLIKLREDLECL
jgi:hypothetical protein